MLYNMINKHLIMPLYFRYTNNVSLPRLNELIKTQYLTPEQIRREQFNNIKKLLIHSYNNVPFYRERFDSVGFNPEKFADLKEFNRIPYLTKKDLQDNLSRLIAANYNKSELIPDASGGSTGKPTNFYKDIRRNRDEKR